MQALSARCLGLTPFAYFYMSKLGNIFPCVVCKLAKYLHCLYGNAYKHTLNLDVANLYVTDFMILQSFSIPQSRPHCVLCVACVFVKLR